MSLGCIEKSGASYAMSTLGTRVSRLPLPVHHGVALLESMNNESLSCSVQVAQLVSLMSVESILNLPFTDSEQLQINRKRQVPFKHPHITSPYSTSGTSLRPSTSARTSATRLVLSTPSC